MLEKLEAEIKFKEGEVGVLIPESKYIQASVFLLQEDKPVSGEIPTEVEEAVIPFVWAGEVPGRSKKADPVRIDLKPELALVRLKQYPKKIEAKLGLLPLIQKFLKSGLLKECGSKYNTPILPVKKVDRKTYRLVQDLRSIDQIVQDIYSVVANPYTLTDNPDGKAGLVCSIGFKRCLFFCILLAFESQEMFGFEWENPETGRQAQYTWTVLPQGFKNSPTIFGNQLAKELKICQTENRESVMLQYVDDILLAGETPGKCLKLTISPLNFLRMSGY